MTRFCALGAAVVACAFGTAAAADVGPTGSDPFAISLGVTFSESAPVPMSVGIAPPGDDLGDLQIDTLSATVATGGTTAVSNATAAIVDGDRASTSNGGASSNAHMGFQSDVRIDDGGFTSNVGTGDGNNFN